MELIKEYGMLKLTHLNKIGQQMKRPGHSSRRCRILAILATTLLLLHQKFRTSNMCWMKC